MVSNSKYTILIDGYRWYPGHLAVFIKNLKKANPLIDITLTTTRDLSEFPKDIIESTKKIIRIPTYSGQIRNKSVRKFIESFLYVKVFAQLSLKNKYGIINIHYPSPRVYHALPWMKRMTKNIVLTPWGSDVMRVEGTAEMLRMRKIYNAATHVMVDPESQLGIEVVTKFKCKASKILPFIWGLDFVDYIEEKKPKMTVEESKARFGLAGKYVITCGYNSRLAQRHEAIIEAIATIKDQLPSNLILLFPFTYGKQPWEGYDQVLLKKCAESGLDGVVINDYLDYSELYSLRNATDMFVHVQTTDAASACVMQYILCNKKIVHGSWIKYRDLERFNPLFYFPVNRLEDLGDVILSAYQSAPIRVSQELIDSLLAKGWNSNMKQFNSLFELLH